MYTGRITQKEDNSFQHVDIMPSTSWPRRGMTTTHANDRGIWSRPWEYWRGWTQCPMSNAAGIRWLGDSKGYTPLRESIDKPKRSVAIVSKLAIEMEKKYPMSPRVQELLQRPTTYENVLGHADRAWIKVGQERIWNDAATTIVSDKSGIRFHNSAEHEGAMTGRSFLVQKVEIGPAGEPVYTLKLQCGDVIEVLLRNVWGQSEPLD